MGTSKLIKILPRALQELEMGDTSPQALFLAPFSFANALEELES
jgi:hypothetical protein